MSEPLWRQAERVLLGETLQDKLSALDGEDAPLPTLLSDPEHPSRPPELAFTPARKATRSPRPSPDAMRESAARARALHAFVNHELLALELFAHALLRFPEAPPAIRAGWRMAARDEQRHLAMYLDRLSACGSALGEEPVSAFFWDALHATPDATSFTLGMALVLEQANLDFSLGWADVFTQVGDTQTADVLREVYADEIRHVRIGAVLLGREVQRTGQDPVELLASHLRPPLQIARARGRGVPFDRAGRISAGIDPAVIDAVEVSGGSLGRDPRVFWFDPFAEEALAGRPVPTSGRAAEIASDLAALPALLAASDDIVLAPPPSVPFLRTLRQAGFPLPRFAATPEEIGSCPGGARATARPWARGPRAERTFAGLSGAGRLGARREIYDRRFSFARAPEWSEGLPTHESDRGVVCTEISEVCAAAERGPCVIKAMLSASGTHRVRAAGALGERELRWVRRALQEGEAVLVEPWLPVAAEISALGEIEDNGNVRILGLTRFGAALGVYRGTVLGPPDLGVGPALRRFLRGEGEILRGIERAAHRAGQALSAEGHGGLFGADILIVEQEGGYRVKFGELNPRTTMGHVALAIRRRLAPGTVGVHLILPASALTDALTEHFAREMPVGCVGGRLASGYLPTNEHPRASVLRAAIVVGTSWQQMREGLERSLASHPGGQALRGMLSFVGLEA